MIDVFVYDKKIKKIDFTKENLLRFKRRKIWIDAISPTKDDFKILKEVYNLHPLTVEDLAKQNVRVKIEEFDNYLLLVFYGLCKNKTIELHEIDFVLGKNFIISSHPVQVLTIDNFKNSPDKIEKLFKRGVDFIMHKLLDLEVDNYFPVLEEFDDLITKMDEQVSLRPRPELIKKILENKRKLSAIKKITLPQREKLSFLTKEKYKFISAEVEVYLRDVYDNSIRISDRIDSYREALTAAYDAYLLTISNTMNEVMKMLSVIATLVLPLTFITGIYGMNFPYMPFLHHQYGFWIVAGSMIVLAACMFIYFKKKNWV